MKDFQAILDDLKFGENAANPHSISKRRAAAAPLRRRAAAPLRRRAAAPLRRRAVPLRARAVPLRARAAPLRARASPVRRRAACTRIINRQRRQICLQERSQAVIIFCDGARNPGLCRNRLL